MIGAFSTSTTSVDSATWSLSALSLPVSESRSASRRVSSDSIATTSPIERASDSSARTRSTLARWLATRAPRSTTSSVASTTCDVRLVTWPRPAIESISWSSRSAGTRTVSWAPESVDDSCDTVPAAPTTAARTRRVAATGSSASTDSCAVRTSDRVTPPIGTEPGSACAGAGAAAESRAAAPPPLSALGGGADSLVDDP